MAPSWNFAGPAALVARQSGIGNDINNVKNTFSSWDSCMSKAYCKWPVIAAIVIGSLIVLSILFCVVRCCCCGMECCCGICGCCNACCPNGRRGNKQYQPAPQQPMYPPPGWGAPPSGPTPWQPQPQPQNTMMYGGAAGFPSQNPIPASASYEQAPKREKSGAAATTSPRSAEDQLPAMPSWAAAREHHVEDTSYQPAEDKAATHAEESVPLQPLQEARRPSPSPAAAAYTDNIPLQDRRSPPARDHAGSPALSSAYGQGSAYAPTLSGTEPFSPSTAYGGAVAAPTAAHAARAYPPEKPALNTSNLGTNPPAFARLPHSASPISPVTPAASSIYSTNPPPSYTTQPAPFPQRGMTPAQSAYTAPTQYQAPAPSSTPAPAPSRAATTSPYSAYNPYTAPAASSPPPVPTPAPAPAPAPTYQAYNPFASAAGQSAAAPAEMGQGQSQGQSHSELGGQSRAEMGPRW